MKIFLSVSIAWGLLALAPLGLSAVCSFKNSCEKFVPMTLSLISLYSLITLFFFIKAVKRLRIATASVVDYTHYSRKVYWFGPISVLLGFSLACWTYSLETQSHFEKFSVIYSLSILSLATMYSTTLWILSYPFYLTLCIHTQLRRKRIASISTVIAMIAMFLHALGFTIFEEPLYRACDKLQVKSFSSTSGITSIFVLGCFIFWVKASSKTPNDIFFSSLYPTNSIRYNFCRRLIKYFFVCFLSSGVFLPSTVIFLSRNSQIPYCKIFLGVSFVEFVLTLWISSFCLGMMVYLVRKHKRDVRRYQEAALVQEQENQQYYGELEHGLTSVVYQKATMIPNVFEVSTEGEKQSLAHLKLEVDEADNGLNQKLLTLEEERCPICWVNFEDGASQVIYIKQCNHVFHDNCLRSWVRRQHDSCPYCRAKIQL